LVEPTPLQLAALPAFQPPLVTTLQVLAPAPRPHVHQGCGQPDGPPPAPPTARQARTNHLRPPNSASPTSLAPTPAPAQRPPAPKGPIPADQGRQRALAVLRAPTPPPPGGCQLPRAPSAGAGPSPTPLAKASACCVPPGGTTQLAAASLCAHCVSWGSFPTLWDWLTASHAPTEPLTPPARARQYAPPVPQRAAPASRSRARAPQSPTPTAAHAL
jgi:hypothetical protein